jgi:hypothetical protein
MIHNKLINTTAVLASLLFFPLISSASGQYRISQFIDPATCGDCHVEIHGQWENSMHNLSEKDPIYLLLSQYLRVGLTDPDEIKEAESCVKCHVPVGVVTGYPEKVSDDKKKIPELAMQGIQCDYCHSATGAKKMYNNGLILDPGNGEEDPGIKRGPFHDSESDFHDSEFSEFHTSSKICGTCHDVRHVVFGTKLETTYEEWENGPYNSDDPKKRVTCQGCHMYQRPGIPATGSTPRPANKGRAAEDGPIRDHIFTHYFVGANSYIPGDKIKQKMAEDRLKHSATITIDREQLKNNRLELTVKNTGAGHYLPTGLTDLRQMWIEVTVNNEKGQTIYSSGRLDKDNYLPDGAIIFNTVFGDGKGHPTINISKAREILHDKRIPPLQSLSETVELPEGDWKQITVTARLLYRSAPQKILDIVSKKGRFALPVVTMAETREHINIK